MLPGMQHMTGDNLDTHSVLHLREDHRPGSAHDVRDATGTKAAFPLEESA